MDFFFSLGLGMQVTIVAGVSFIVLLAGCLIRNYFEDRNCSEIMDGGEADFGDEDEPSGRKRKRRPGQEAKKGISKRRKKASSSRQSEEDFEEDFEDDFEDDEPIENRPRRKSSRRAAMRSRSEEEDDLEADFGDED